MIKKNNLDGKDTEIKTCEQKIHILEEKLHDQIDEGTKLREKLISVSKESVDEKNAVSKQLLEIQQKVAAEETTNKSLQIELDKVRSEMDQLVKRNKEKIGNETNNAEMIEAFKVKLAGLKEELIKERSEKGSIESVLDEVRLQLAQAKASSTTPSKNSNKNDNETKENSQTIGNSEVEQENKNRDELKKL